MGVGLGVNDRILLVFDGNAWFIRHVRTIEHDLTKDEKVYRCDVHLGGPFTDLGEAAGMLVRLVEDYEKLKGAG